MKPPLSLTHVAALDLDCDVLDTHLPHQRTGPLEDVLLSVGVADDGVRAQRHEPGGDRPDV